MKKNMIKWKNSIIASQEVKAMPIMAYEGLTLLRKNILEMVTSGEVHYLSLKALSERYPSMAAVTLAMALYMEAEAFGSEINYYKNEIPSVSKRLINSFSSLEKIRIPEIGEGKTGETLKAAKLSMNNITDRPVLGELLVLFH